MVAVVRVVDLGCERIRLECSGCNGIGIYSAERGSAVTFAGKLFNRFSEKIEALSDSFKSFSIEASFRIVGFKKK